MKIIDKKDKLNELQPGDIFRYKNTIYMIIFDTNPMKYRVLRVEDGIVMIDSYDSIEKIFNSFLVSEIVKKAELHILE